MERDASTVIPENIYVKCPECQALLPSENGNRPWCDQCGWNVELPANDPAETLLARFHQWFSKRWGDRLHRQMMQEQPGNHRVSPAEWVALLLAVLANGLTLLLVGLGMYLILRGPSASPLINTLAGLFCFLLAFFVLPHLPSPQRTLRLKRNEFPAIYRLADRVAAELGIRPVDEIHCSLDFNASMTRKGWRQKRVLQLGLPLMAVLSGKEWVALLGHEMGHLKNRDYEWSLFILLALNSLENWFEILNPARLYTPALMERYSGTLRLMILLLTLLTLPLAGLTWVWMYLLMLLFWRKKQQNEYQADGIAAQLAGTQACLSLFRRLILNEVYEKELSFSYLAHDEQDFLPRLRRRFDQITLRDEMRVLWVEKRTHTGIDGTHPSTMDRIEYLKKNRVSLPKIALSPWDEAQIQKECEALFNPLLRQIFQLDPLTFREKFVTKGW